MKESATFSEWVNARFWPLEMTSGKLTFTCSNSTKETMEKDVKYVQN